ncbi:MAG: VOC family protein [Clostridium sp.]|uniref:VOC family protein n=1 Tax=Clostridium sp. TaxID=1506 RepID=UPI002914C7AE|nr:VOC family protein [Clostridium sp.]MDU7337957.1 VOC family protein [Clostridium sp.]
MKVSHIIMKVGNLQKAVEKYREMGFTVEYGSAKNPYNAIIYFSDGPYLELLASTGMPSFVKRMMRLFGKSELAERMDTWDSHTEGPCGLALETYEKNFNREKKLLNQANEPYVEMPSRRNDTKGRKLRFTCLFPNNLQIPFLMTYFNIDPKPQNFVHPNGAKRIRSVAFGTSKEYMPLICALCEDPTLVLFEGNQIHSIVLEYNTGETHILPQN